MNLLGAKLYDPAVAVSKATSSLIAMTAFDTTNLRLAVTVPAHGFVRFRLTCNLSGATTMPQVMLGVLNGATVVGRVVPQGSLPGTAVATTNVPLVAEFTVAGLTPGAANFDAAYAVETVVASTNIHYGGPNDTSANNAWGGFSFEAWDPQPIATAGQLSVDANGRVDVIKVAGTTQTARDIGGAVPAAAAGASGGLLISGSNAGTTTLGALTVTGATTLTGAVSAINASNDLRLNGVAAGGSGGVLISGSNAGTTTFGALTVTGATTHTGNVLFSDGITVSAPSTTNRPGLYVKGNGASSGIYCEAGNTVGSGIYAKSPNFGSGICAEGPQGVGSNGIGFLAQGASIGMQAIGGAFGRGIDANGGAGGITVDAWEAGGTGITVQGLGQGFYIGSGTAGGLYVDQMAIAGTTEFTGNVSFGDGITVAAPTTLNRPGVSVSGNGNAAAVRLVGGATGEGLKVQGGATSGSAVSIESTDGHGIVINADGAFNCGIYVSGTGTGGDDILLPGSVTIGQLNAVAVMNMTDCTFPQMVVSTNNDKTGYALSSAGVQAIWDALTSALTTVGSIGKWIVDKLDATISSRLASASYTAPPSVGDIADQVWDEALSGHATAGSAGAALSAAGTAGDPWSTVLPGAYTIGTAGYIIGNNLDAPISVVDTVVDSIKSTVDTNLDAAVSSRLADADFIAPDNATISTIGSTVATNLDATVSSRLASSSYEAPDNATIGVIAGYTDSIESRIPAALVGGRMDASVGAMANNVITAAATASDFGAEVADAVHDEVVEGTTTLRESVRLINAAVAGKASGLDGTTAVYRDLADTKDRITATVDANGNRTAVTRDVT